jgi:serine phosphatase RsbU (regulator of sigma subunit)
VETYLSPVEWGAASRPVTANSPLGDGWMVRASGNTVLLATLDALGHGPEAATSTSIACEVLAGDLEAPLESLLTRAHQRLRGTRGAAMSLARIDVPSSSMSWIGVGNVEGLVLRADPEARPRRHALLLRSGIAGRTLPLLAAQRLTLAAGDVVLFATDGIDQGFAEDTEPLGTAQRIADRVLERHFIGKDDGLVLAVRFRGGPA